MSSDQNPQNRDPSPKQVGPLGTSLLGIYLLLLALFLSYLIYGLWPVEKYETEKKPATQTEATATATKKEANEARPEGEDAVESMTNKDLGTRQKWEPGISLFCNRVKFNVTDEIRLILLVLAIGALGSYIHAATSFATYVGNRLLKSSWVWWYILRPPIGAALALIFYFLIRGGLLSAGASVGDLSIYGVVAIAGLTGMFSKNASDKMEELFKTLFKTEAGGGDDAREDKLTENPLPSIVAIEPPNVTVGTVSFSASLKGSNFIKDSVAHVKGLRRETEFKSQTELIVYFDDGDIATAGSIDVTVVNPPPGGGTSKPVTFAVN